MRELPLEGVVRMTEECSLLINNNEVLEKKVDPTAPQSLVQLVHVILGALCDLRASICVITHLIFEKPCLCDH
jgi:hypothetical protein